MDDYHNRDNAGRPEGRPYMSAWTVTLRSAAATIAVSVDESGSDAARSNT